MRRMATLLAAAAVVASGLSVTSAFAHEGWRNRGKRPGNGGLTAARCAVG